MSEEEFLNRILNKIAKEFGYDTASTLELMFMTREKKVEQLEKENEYLKMSNPEQNMEHFRIVNENKRKIDMLRKENHQLENIRKEAIDYMKEFIFEPLLINEDRKLIMFNENLKNFENILNKGDNNVKD